MNGARSTDRAGFLPVSHPKLRKHSLPKPNHYLRRPGRWLRRTRFLAAQTLADIGLRGATTNGPAWLRDNPFLLKTGRTETRRFGLFMRLLVALLVLSGLLLGGLWLNQKYSLQLMKTLGFLFAASFPPALFIVLTFVHTTLISSARTTLAVSLANEARRGTLPDLLLTPLHRAEMLLAMGVGPARTAFLVALAGLPIYILLGQIGALSGSDILFLYLFYALISYLPPVYALPALAGGALTPETELGKFAATRSQRPGNRNAFVSAVLPIILGVFFLGQAIGFLGVGWFAHLLAALHLQFTPGASFLLFFSWPYYSIQILSSRLDFFHLTLSPLWFILPLIAARWVASALGSAAALSAGDIAEIQRLPQQTRARTLTRWTARIAALCALGVVWKAWVESGDTASLAGTPYGVAGADAAGLLLLLGGWSLPNVCRRALMADPRRADTGALRSPLLALRQAAKRAVRPLGVVLVTFLLACALGGLSPFAPPVYQMAGKIALTAAASVLWAVGIRRVLPLRGKLSAEGLQYVLPVAMLSIPVPGASLLSTLSPVTAWLMLFPSVPGLLHRLPWTVATPPPLEICLAGASLTGLALIAATWGVKTAPLPQVWGAGTREEAAAGLIPSGSPNLGLGASPATTKRRPLTRPTTLRNQAETAALMGWITARTDNPLFTYEMRTRTRAGGWADWRIFAPLALLASLILTAAYPDIIAAISMASPFRFFGGFPSIPPAPSDVLADARANLASLLLAAQCYLIGFRGQLVGEGLIARDRQRGIWGFLLLTPLTAGQIFWGKVAGQTALPGAAWAVCGLGSLVLYAFAAPSFGLFPCLAAWLVGQGFVAALFLLGFSLGAAISTYPAISKGMRGFSGLLFTALVGFGVWAELQWLPWDLPGDWTLMAERLGLSIGYALVLAVPLRAFAQWRIGDIRRRDVAFGDGVEN